jgi:hypothetical protein
VLLTIIRSVIWNNAHTVTLHGMRSPRWIVVLFCAFVSVAVHGVPAPAAEVDEPKGIPAIESDFLYLTMNKSSLPFQEVGWGVFSKVPIYKIEIICEYRGAVIPDNVEFKSDYIYSSTTITGEKVHIVPDMNKPICAYINDCVKILGSNYSNAELDAMQASGKELPTYDGFHHNAGTLTTNMGKIFIVATEDIPARTEIFYPYGFYYWVTRLRNPAYFGIPISPPS